MLELFLSLGEGESHALLILLFVLGLGLGIHAGPRPLPISPGRFMFGLGLVSVASGASEWAWLWFNAITLNGFGDLFVSTVFAATVGFGLVLGNLSAGRSIDGFHRRAHAWLTVIPFACFFLWFKDSKGKAASNREEGYAWLPGGVFAGTLGLILLIGGHASRVFAERAIETQVASMGAIEITEVAAHGLRLKLPLQIDSTTTIVAANAKAGVMDIVYDVDGISDATVARQSIAGIVRNALIPSMCRSMGWEFWNTGAQIKATYRAPEHGVIYTQTFGGADCDR